MYKWQFKTRPIYANETTASRWGRWTCKNGCVWLKWMCLKPLVYEVGSDSSRLNIHPFFTAPPLLHALEHNALYFFFCFFLVLRSIRGAHALIKNELAPLPLVYLKWMRAAVGAYLSPPDFHGTLWRTGRAKMQNFSSSPPHRLRRASIALLTLRWAAPTTFVQAQ